MATRSHIADDLLDDIPEPMTTQMPAPKAAHSNDDLIPDIPDEINDEGTVRSNTFTSSENTVDLETLRGLGFNKEQDELDRKKLNPPRGDYEKEGPFRFEARIFDGDCAMGDINPQGRTVYNFSGTPKTLVVNGMEYKPTLFISMSPDVRHQERDPSKVDNKRKLFVQAKDLFLALHGREAANHAELVVMLMEDPYVINTMVRTDDGGLQVVNIKKKVQRRS
jgi:hypothetical protein